MTSFVFDNLVGDIDAAASGRELEAVADRLFGGLQEEITKGDPQSLGELALSCGRVAARRTPSHDAERPLWDAWLGGAFQAMASIANAANRRIMSEARSFGLVRRLTSYSNAPKVLRALENGEMNMGDLAIRVGKSPPQITKEVRRLSGFGLVDTEEVGRVTWVWLTSTGLWALNEISKSQQVKVAGDDGAVAGAYLLALESLRRDNDRGTSGLRQRRGKRIERKRRAV